LELGEGEHPSSRGDNSKSVNKKLKISRSMKPISIKLSSNHPCVKGIHVCSNKGPSPLQKGDNHKNKAGPFNYFLKNH
jgi:hypothetical protein